MSFSGEGLAGRKVSCVMANGTIHTGSLLGLDSLRNVSLSNAETTSTSVTGNSATRIDAKSALMFIRGANMLYLDISDS